MAQAVLEKGKQAYNLEVKPIFQVISNSQKFPLPISRIEYDGIKLAFYKPYKMTVEFDDEFGCLKHRNAKLGIVISAYTLDELVAEFFEWFVSDWRGYAQADNSKLSECAIEQKHTLLSMAMEVE